MKRFLIVLLACASHAFAGPNVRVSIDAEGDGSGLILQAYTACLRNTPAALFTSAALAYEDTRLVSEAAAGPPASLQRFERPGLALTA